MGVLKLARRAALTTRYVATTGSEGGRVVLVPGEPEATERLRALLQVPLQDQPETGALAVYPVAPDADPAPVAEALSARADTGERSLAVILGSPERRAEAEAVLLAAPGVEMSSIAHVARLDRRGERLVLDGVIRQLGDELVAAGRLNPALRPAVGAHLVSRASGAAGVLSSGAVGRRARMLALTTLQVRMLADLAAVHDRPLDARRAGDIAVVVGSGFAWRLIGRGATAVLPAPSTVMRGGIAYAATRALGELARRRLAAGGDLADLRPATIKETLARLRPGASASPTQEEAA